MKKSKIEVLKKALLLSGFLCINTATTGIYEVEALDNIVVVVNGTAINFESAKPLIDNDRTLVPLRGVFETMGFEIVWDNEVWSNSSSELINIGYGSSNPELIQIVSGINIVNGGDISILKDNTIMQGDNVVETDVTPKNINGSYYLPLRAITEATGAEVVWNQENKIVTIDFTPTPVNGEIEKSEVEPEKIDLELAISTFGSNYVGKWGDGSGRDNGVGGREYSNLDNYSHKVYIKDAPEGNGVVPTGAYYVETDNAPTMHERSDDNPYPKHSISLGGVKLANGKELYIGEYRSSIEEKFGKPNKTSEPDYRGVQYQYTDSDTGFTVMYTESGRVKRIYIQSGKYNDYANKGFTYGTGTTYLGQEKGTEVYGPGESKVYDYIRYDGLFFGDEMVIDYWCLAGNDTWSSIGMEARIPGSDSGTRDPF